MVSASIFRIERRGNTLVVEPTHDLGSLDADQLQQGAEEVFRLLKEESISNLVINLANTSYFGSTALELFIRFWKRISARDGRMAICGVSPYELEVLQTVKLDSLWPIHSSPEEAVAAIGV